MKKVLSFDFGASSGRAMLATLENGKIEMKEIHRFSNDPVIVNGTMYWDVLRLFFEIKAGITLFPLKTVSDSQPAPTVPTMANMAEKPIIQLADSNEYSRAP